MMGMVRSLVWEKKKKTKEQSSYSIALRSGVEKTKLDLIQSELLRQS